MISLIGVNETNRLKTILAEWGFDEKIEINEPSIKLSLKTNGLSDRVGDGSYKYFLDENDESNVLAIGNKKYQLYVFIGDWGYDVNVPEAHISLGCDRFHKFFAQIELSYCLMDDTNVYIVKNMKLAGPASMSRLNGGAGSKEQKRQRRFTLMQQIGAERLNYQKQEWLCLYKISKRDLFDETKVCKVVHSFWNAFLKYTFKVEAIRKEDVI